MILKHVQVSTYWNWGDVHAADKYLEDLERLRDSNATSDQCVFRTSKDPDTQEFRDYRRAHFLKNELSKLGLSSATQQYIFRSNKEVSLSNVIFHYTLNCSKGYSRYKCICCLGFSPWATQRSNHNWCLLAKQDWGRKWDCEPSRDIYRPSLGPIPEK